MNRGSLAALAHIATWFVVMAVSLFVKAGSLVAMGTLKPLGIAIFVFGMLVFVWAVAYLKGAFLGNVEPVSDTLIQAGPYRFVRHPVYLGMTIATLGLAIGMRSLWGVVGVFLLFVPAGVYRAKHEEDALARRFGAEWDAYVENTYFMFPPLY